MHPPEPIVRSGLSIAKQRLPVDLLLEGGRRVEGEVFVLPLLSERGGRETLLDLLQLPEPFLPCSTRRGMLLVQRQRIIWARVTEPRDAGISELTGAVDTPIALALAGGLAATAATLEGVLRRWPSPGGERLLDTLADPVPFLALQQDEGILLVAKSYIVSAEERPPARRDARPPAARGATKHKATKQRAAVPAAPRAGGGTRNKRQA